MYDCSKEQSAENLTKRDTSIQKTDYLFDRVVIIKNRE